MPATPKEGKIFCFLSICSAGFQELYIFLVIACFTIVSSRRSCKNILLKNETGSYVDNDDKGCCTHGKGERGHPRLPIVAKTSEVTNVSSTLTGLYVHEGAFVEG